MAVAAPELCKHVLVFNGKKGKKSVLFIYGNVLEFSFTLEKLEKSACIMCKSSRLAGSTFWKLFAVFILYAQ